MRFHRRLRRLPWRLAAEHSDDGVARLRARLSVRLARASCRKRRRSETSSTRGTSAASPWRRGATPMLSRYYIQCGVDDDDCGMAGRPVLGGAEAPVPGRDRREDRDRPVDRKVDRALAQLRRRADALRAALSRRRRRPHRSADGRQGPEPRGLGRVLSPSRADGPFPTRATTAISTATRTWRCDACGARCASPGS